MRSRDRQRWPERTTRTQQSMKKWSWCESEGGCDHRSISHPSASSGGRQLRRYPLQRSVTVALFAGRQRAMTASVAGSIWRATVCQLSLQLFERTTEQRLPMLGHFTLFTGRHGRRWVLTGRRQRCAFRRSHLGQRARRKVLRA